MATSFSNINASLLTSKLKIRRSKPTFPISFSTHKIPSPWLQPTNLSLNYSPTKPFKISSIMQPNTDQDLNSELDEKLADRWMKIHGEDDWVGLLDPLDPTLRSELNRYGEMAQACYEAFESDPHSIHCGSCKYTEAEFFTVLQMDTRIGYTVTRYLYATSTINLPDLFKKLVFRKQDEETLSGQANWIGYVAISDDDTSARLGRRDIVVAWRGTVTKVEWIHNLIDILRPVSSHRIPCLDPSVKVESGFERLYTAKQTFMNAGQISQSPRDQVLEEIDRLISEYGDYKKDNLKLSITMTGHSLGSALAVLSAFDVAETGMKLTRVGREVKVSVVSFAGPRVGNMSFKERLDSLGVKVLRIYNVHDVVPTAPGFLVNEHWPSLVSFFDGLFPWCYAHVGAHLALDHDNSTFLKPGRKKRATAHSLELLLHLLDGYQGRGEQFQLATPRDIALLNKDADLLKEEYNIPPFWRLHHPNKSFK